MVPLDSRSHGATPSDLGEQTETNIVTAVVTHPTAGTTPMTSPIEARVALDPDQMHDILQTLKALERNPSPKPTFWIKRLWRWITTEAGTAIGTLLLGFLTMGVILVTLTAIWTESEHRLLPIVALDVNADSGKLVVQNIGFGPALNTRDIEFRKGSTLLRMVHLATLKAGQEAEVAVYRVVDGKDPVLITSDEFFTQMRALFSNEVAKWPGKGFCIGYVNADADWYETRQTLRFSEQKGLEGMKGLILEFRSRAKVGKNEKAPCR